MTVPEVTEIGEKYLNDLSDAKLVEILKIVQVILKKRFNELKGVMGDVSPQEQQAPAQKRKYTKKSKADKAEKAAKPHKARKPRGEYSKLAMEILTNAKEIAGKEWRKQLKAAGASNASTIIQQLEKKDACKKNEAGNYVLAK